MSLRALFSPLAALAARPMSGLWTASAVAVAPGLLWRAALPSTQVATFKVKSSIKKRCEHCYFVKRRGRLQVSSGVAILGAGIES